MALKYLKIHDALNKTSLFTGITSKDAEEVDVNGKNEKKKVLPKLLRGDAHIEFKDAMVPCLKDLRDWCVNVQLPVKCLNLSSARTLFAGARSSPKLKNHSVEFVARLQPTHSLVVSPHFENGVVKTINGDTETMSPEEKEACEVLKKTKWPHLHKELDHQDEAITGEKEMSSPRKFAKMICKSGTVTKRESTVPSIYLSNCNWIIPTTVEVEQLFSKCSHVMTADRRKMHPRLFEAIIFLKENVSFWDLDLVHSMLNHDFDDALQRNYEGHSDFDEMEDDDGAEH